MKTRGYHPDYRIAISVYGDSFSDDVRCGAELALPQARAYQGHGRGSLAIFIWGKQTATSGVHAQRLEEAGGNHTHAHALGFPASSDAEIVVAIGHEGGKTGIAALPILEIRIRDRKAIENRALLGDNDQFVRPWKRQRTKQHAVDYRKKRGVRADAESERQHSNQNEAWALQQHARRVFQVLNQGFHF